MLQALHCIKQKADISARVKAGSVLEGLPWVTLGTNVWM